MTSWMSVEAAQQVRSLGRGYWTTWSISCCLESPIKRTTPRTVQPESAVRDKSPPGKWTVLLIRFRSIDSFCVRCPSARHAFLSGRLKQSWTIGIIVSHVFGALTLLIGFISTFSNSTTSVCWSPSPPAIRSARVRAPVNLLIIGLPTLKFESASSG